MTVRPYEDKDFEQIKSWARPGINYDPELFPRTGYIVDNICAYFLYETDSRVAWLENLISNKDSDKEERRKAIGMVIDALIIEAKRKGYKVLYATTSNSNLITRAMLIGAKPELNQVLLQLAIPQRNAQTDPSL